MFHAMTENRTPDICLEGRYFTTKLSLLRCLLGRNFSILIELEGGCLKLATSYNSTVRFFIN
jgi:hypothetical protein